MVLNLKKEKFGTLKLYFIRFEIFLEFVLKKGKRSYFFVIDMDIKN